MQRARAAILARAAGGCLLTGLLVSLLSAAEAALVPADWKHRQELPVAQPGLVKLNLPTDTLEAARPGLEDLRVLDPAGREVPYLIERSLPRDKAVRNAKDFQVLLTASATVLTVDTGTAEPLEGLTLVTPANNFVKGVTIEHSRDRQNWETLATGVPVFCRPSGASRLYLALPRGVRPFLRLTVDDRRSEPIPFSGVRVHGAAEEPSPPEPVVVTLLERNENPGQTRCLLGLPRAHLQLATVEIETPDPLFTREVTVAARLVEEGVVKESPLARGTVYRLAVAEATALTNLTIPVEALIRTRELVLFIENQDSPPLQITAVRAYRRPTHLVFLAQQAGVYHLLTGNGPCPAPRYDVAGLAENFKKTGVTSHTLAGLLPNPDYRTPETLPAIQEIGPALDLKGWSFRKAVGLAGDGVQQLDLDWELVSQAGNGFRDLRLARGDRQIPYILEQTSIRRPLTPQATPDDDPKKPKASRWRLKLAYRSLPVERLVCTSRTPLFQREVMLVEEIADERGAKRIRLLGQASWARTPDRPAGLLTLSLTAPPTSDTLWLETQNGDNPPVEFEAFQLYLPTTRLLFKATADPNTYLYYGNRQTGFPQYDLRLVADQLLAAEKKLATLGPAERLRKSSWGERVQATGAAGVLFWGVLVVVVVALLIVIARLLPKSAPPTA